MELTKDHLLEQAAMIFKTANGLEENVTLKEIYHDWLAAYETIEDKDKS